MLPSACGHSIKYGLKLRLESVDLQRILYKCKCKKCENWLTNY